MADCSRHWRCLMRTVGLTELVQRYRTTVATNRKFLAIWQERNMHLWQKNMDGSETDLTEQSVLLLRENIDLLSELIDKYDRGQL